MSHRHQRRYNRSALARAKAREPVPAAEPSGPPALGRVLQPVRVGLLGVVPAVLEGFWVALFHILGYLPLLCHRGHRLDDVEEHGLAEVEAVVDFDFDGGDGAQTAEEVDGGRAGAGELLGGAGAVPLLRFRLAQDGATVLPDLRRGGRLGPWLGPRRQHQQHGHRQHRQLQHLPTAQCTLQFSHSVKHQDITLTQNSYTLIIGGSCHKYNICRDESIVATITCLSRQPRLLSRQKYACRDKRFVATNTCESTLFIFATRMNKTGTLSYSVIEPTHQRFPQSVQFQHNRFTNTR